MLACGPLRRRCADNDRKISRAVYHHLTYQLLTLYRGALVSLIFYETLEVDTSELAESASVTLMSTDIDYICTAFQDIHELWANPIELGLAIFLLWRQIGAPCFVVAVPTIRTFLCWSS